MRVNLIMKCFILTFRETPRLYTAQAWLHKLYYEIIFAPETLLRNGDMELRARQEEIRILELEVKYSI